eukprot:7395680-Pyramimonas_sp.AAC.1
MACAVGSGGVGQGKQVQDGGPTGPREAQWPIHLAMPGTPSRRDLLQSPGSASSFASASDAQ